MALKIGILTTHPIQYQVPWFRLLAHELDIDLCVFYCMIPNAKQQGDGFGINFLWNIPLLEGYSYRVLSNVAKNPSLTKFSGCDTPEIFDIVKQEKWDAFIVNGWVVKSCLQLLTACRIYQVPCIVRGESNNFPNRAWWKKTLQRLLVKQYSSYLYIGEANRRFYLDLGIEPKKLFFTPYCIDNDRFISHFQKLQNQKCLIQHQFGLIANVTTFLFCAKFSPKKHPLELLQAIHQLKEKDKFTGQLLMVGDGELRKMSEAYVQKHKLPVKFTGFLNQADIASAYVASDCLVLPSDEGETWGLVVNEAMACGLPAIVSDRVGCRMDLVHEHRTGWVYPHGNIKELAESLRCACEYGVSGLSTLGKNSKQLVTEGYNYKLVISGIRDCLNFTFQL